MAMSDLPQLDSEEVGDLTLAELYLARSALSARIDALKDQREVVDAELLKRGPARFGDVVMLPAPPKWSPYDKTFAAVRHWCETAEAFTSIAHFDYIRVTGLYDLARERAMADGEDEEHAKLTATGVVNGLGSKVPAGEYPTFVPLHKAAKKWHRLPDALA